MSLYEDLVMQTQMNYSRYYGTYMSGQAPYKMSEKKIPYEEQIELLVQKVQEADGIIVGGASGLSLQEAGIFIMRIKSLIGNILNHLQRSIISKEHLMECSILLKQEKNIGVNLATFLHTTQNASCQESRILIWM